MDWNDYPICSIDDLLSEVKDVEAIVGVSVSDPKFEIVFNIKRFKAKSRIRKRIISELPELFAVRTSVGKTWQQWLMDSGYTFDYLLKDDFILTAITNPQELSECAVAKMMELFYVDKISSGNIVRGDVNNIASREFWCAEYDKRWEESKLLLAFDLDSSGIITDFERLRTRDDFNRT